MPSMPVEILDPRVLKNQKAKPVNVPGHYQSETDSETDSDSDSDSDSSGMHSFSAESVEGDVLNLVNSRSRSVSRGSKKSRDQSRHRSQSRGGRVTKGYKEKGPRGNARVLFNPPPIGVHSGRSIKGHSPTSSNSHLPPPQQIHIQVNTAPPNTMDNDREHERERTGSHSQPHAGDRHQHQRGRSADRHGQRSMDHGRPHSRLGYESNSPRQSPAHSPRQSYSHLDKFPTTHPLSRTSSGDRYSDTASYVDDSSSVRSFGGDSVFSEQLPRSSNRRHTDLDMSKPYNTSGTEYSAPFPGYRSSHDRITSEGRVRPTLGRRATHSVSDYPTSHHQPVRHHRGRAAVHNYDAGRSSDDDNSTATWPPRTRSIRHHPRPQDPNPFDALRYPAQRSLPYYPTPKALPEAPSRQDPFDMHEIVEATVEATVEALREKNMNAYEHIHRSRQRQPLVRSNTVDAWANPTYQPGADSHRSGLQKAVLADGRSVYVDV